MTFEEAENICDKAAEKAGEHFDSVLVLATWTNDTETHRVFGKSGNWFSCLGLAHDFLESSSQEELATKIAEAIEGKEGWDGND